MKVLMLTANEEVSIIEEVSIFRVHTILYRCLLVT